MSGLLEKFRPWVWAARPKTLGAAVAPVLVGTAMAIESGVWQPLAAGLTLLSAILIQIGVNYHNDYADYLKGADTEDRVGPLRVTQAGLVDSETMRRATTIVFAGAVLAGGYLINRGGWPILAIGIAAIGTAVWYTAGPYSLSDLGLADVAVFLFFGPVAVAGTYYVQALACPVRVGVAGFGPGLISVAILLVNNVRDVEHDRAAGKRTLVVRFGRTFGVSMYAACLVGALLLPIGLVWQTSGSIWALAPLLLLPLVVRAIHTMIRTDAPEDLNVLLAWTGRLLVLWALLFSVGWCL